MKLFGYEITLRKIQPPPKKGRRTKNCNSVERKAKRQAFFREYERTLMELINEERVSGECHRCEAGAQLVKLARVRLGYSNSTFDYDIFMSIKSGFLKWKEKRDEGIKINYKTNNNA